MWNKEIVIDLPFCRSIFPLAGCWRGGSLHTSPFLDWWGVFLCGSSSSGCSTGFGGPTSGSVQVPGPVVQEETARIVVNHRTPEPSKNEGMVDAMELAVSSSHFGMRDAQQSRAPSCSGVPTQPPMWANFVRHTWLRLLRGSSQTLYFCLTQRRPPHRSSDRTRCWWTPEPPCLGGGTYFVYAAPCRCLKKGRYNTTMAKQKQKTKMKTTTMRIWMEWNLKNRWNW